jgi:hypothetical protein
VEVVSPPESYYPDLTNLKETFGDSKERVRWAMCHLKISIPLHRISNKHSFVHQSLEYFRINLMKYSRESHIFWRGLFFLVVVGFEFRASHLLGRHSSAWVMLLSFFVLVIFEIGSHFLPGLAWTTILLFYTSCCTWDDRYVPPHPAFSVEMRVLLTFLPWLAWNFLVSASL